MYGQFGGMQQSMQKLSEEIRVIKYVTSCEPSELPHQTPLCETVNKFENARYHLFLQAANAHQRTLESEVRIRTAAMDSFDQMNSSLISANISLQVTNQSTEHVYAFCTTERLGLISKTRFLCRNPFWRTVRTEWTQERS